MSKEEYIKAGKIIGAHGIRGGMKVYSYLESPKNFANYKKFFIDKQPVELELNFVKDTVAVIDIEGIRKRELAEAYIGKEIYILKSELPKLNKGEFYYTDLIGLKVKQNGKDTGTITNIQNYGAGEIIEIKFNNGKTRLFAFSKKIFPEINKEAGYVILNAPEEEFDNSKDSKDGEDN